MALLVLFFKSLAIGFSIAAPVGPIGVLCVRRTLAHGFLGGFAAGLGAASADGVYGAIAAFGITAVSRLLVEQAYWLGLGGGALLIWLGYSAMRAEPATRTLADQGPRLFTAYAATFVLTLSNPMTILSFAAIFAALGPIGGEAGWIPALVMIIGVFLGSALWWLGLAGAVGVVRRRVSPATMRWINRISGAVIIVFGVVAIARTLL